MGIWQNLADSYTQNAETLKSTYPLSTTSISNNTGFIAIIVIKGNGEFVRTDKIAKKSDTNKKGPGNPLVNITIPVREESLGRSSGISPHPVFDQYNYLKGKGQKFEAYMANLKDFYDSDFATEQVKAIYRYVDGRTIFSDLQNMNLKDKTNIVFQVEIPGHSQAKVWEDETFFNAWHKYYLDLKVKLAEKKKLAETELAKNKKLSKDEKKQLKEQTKLQDSISLDYITGKVQSVATSHPKKISNASANSKLVSDNDKTNYTFRGKFNNSSEAFSIGYETTQKAHQFLRYLINDRGYYCGEQVILSFSIGTMENTLPPPLTDTKSIWDIMQESQTKTKNDSQIVLQAETGFDYADALKKSFSGFGYGKVLEKHNKTAVIALDAATTGRLSIVFYRELDRTEYLEKISDWHSVCKWNQKFWDKENKKYISYIGAPSVDKIIETIYGKPRGTKDEGYTKIKKTARERLLRCIFDGEHISFDYVTAAIRRASNPMTTTKDGKFDRNGYEQILSTACALVRKHCQQRKEEDYKLSIELDRKDRDYLYGRLLGAADKLEEYALFKKEKDRIVTAAIRHMQSFAQRPFRTWQTIHSCLNPYIQTVKGSFAFHEIQSVKNQFAIEDYEQDTPLDGSYLLGYYHERAHIDKLVENAKNKNQTIDSKKTEGDNV
ncbi:MAG: type I-C CRISPR-associated protein Cas8c/Csd1 [Pseudomonadota bacterium]